MDGAEKEPARPKVLVIDDALEVRDFLTSYLEYMKMSVASASDGWEGLEKAQRDPPDLIISDMVMPRLGGIELCLQVKGTPATALTPVILMTASEDREARIRGLEAGADEFIMKPIDPQELEARVRSLLRQSALQREAAGAIRAGPGAPATLEVLSRILAHDMKNHLSGILGNFHLIQLWQTGLDDKQVRALESARRSCQELQDLVGDFSDVGRLGTATPALERKACRMEDLVQEALEHFSRSDHPRAKGLQAEPCPQPAPVLAEARLVRRALTILLDVALGVSDDGNLQVAVRPLPARGRVETVLAFKGSVVPDELTREIFLPTGPLKARESGYVIERGFSLVLVGLTARAHQGTVVLENLGGGDARFVFALPLAAS